MATIIDVVAAAIVRDHRVLAARRAQPSRHAGGWEFPGGKVEASEDEPSALARECHEELSVEVVVGGQLGVALEGDLRVVLFAAAIDDGDPVLGDDHDEVRWLAVDQLDSVDWLPIDRALLEPVAAHLRSCPQPER